MTILKGIPRVIQPRLLYTLGLMGHGDELVLADANFPAASVAANCPGGLINADGNDIPTLLQAIMQLLPLDETAPPAIVMGMRVGNASTDPPPNIWCCNLKNDPTNLLVLCGPGLSQMPEHRQAGWKTPIWDTYKKIIDEANGSPVVFEEVERFAFYERAKKSYAVVATGETALYGNLILKKGVIGTSG